MDLQNPLYGALGINAENRRQVIKFAKEINVSIQELDYYNSNNILPSPKILAAIYQKLSISKSEIMIKMGIYDLKLKEIISQYLSQIEISEENNLKIQDNAIMVFSTAHGNLYKGDCLSLMQNTGDDVFDLIFADPPFNLKKVYPSRINDNLSTLEYIEWTERWLSECIRTLKKGGSLFLWNIPKWNTYFSNFLNQRLSFKHWIATDIKYSLPIQGKLYPSHYSLLYYVKGEKANTFHPDRLPMETCPKCYGEIKDYGGYKDKMNPLGVNITDVWYDIPPVRHVKHMGRVDANELSIKLLDRIIEMSSDPGDIIFDPFGGSGTTYIVSELKQRRWVGIELGPVDDIINRFGNIEKEKETLMKYRNNYNVLFPDRIKEKRISKGFWTAESVRKDIS